MRCIGTPAAAAAAGKAQLKDVCTHGAWWTPVPQQCSTAHLQAGQLPLDFGQQRLVGRRTLGGVSALQAGGRGNHVQLPEPFSSGCNCGIACYGCRHACFKWRAPMLCVHQAVHSAVAWAHHAPKHAGKQHAYTTQPEHQPQQAPVLPDGAAPCAAARCPPLTMHAATPASAAPQ